MCRPTAEKLLTHKFVAKTKAGPQYVKEHLLADLPPIGERFKKISRRLKDKPKDKKGKKENKEK